MSEDPDRQDDEELEALLRRLEPTRLEVEHLASLYRTRDQFCFKREHSPMTMQWGRVIPLTLVCVVASFGFALLRYGDRLRAPDSSSSLVATETAPASEAPVASRFLPVSSHGAVVNASSGGIVETEDGPRQRLRIDYSDAFHWHDPESGTNIRLFQPRSEEVVVPLTTD